MRTRSPRWWVLGSLLSLVACAADADPRGGDVAVDDSDFAVLASDATLSILPSLESAHGKPVVCVGLIGYQANVVKQAGDAVAARVTTAANKWNALLQGNDLWTVKGRIEPVFAYQQTECPTTGYTFAVNVWASPQRFVSEFCPRMGGSCASAAIPAYRSLYLGPVNRGMADDPFRPFVMLHEYGHLLGLGDTYRVPGWNDWEGKQPSSVMNGKAEELTTDDQLGLWVTLRALKTGVRSCEGYGEEVAMTANFAGVLMCNPNAKPQVDHDRPNPPPALVLPREGTWAYEGYPLGSASMRVHSVKKSGSGYTMSVTGFRSGQALGPASPFVCDAAGTCAAKADRSYRLLVTDASTMRVITSSAPAGMQLTFASP